MFRIPTLSLTLVSAVLVACRPAAAPPPVPESGSFVVRLGNDTVAVEQYTRIGNRIEGRLLSRTPRTAVTSYVITLDAAGRPATLEQQTRLPDGSMVPNAARSVSVTFGSDSLTTRIQRDTVATLRVAAREAFPFINTAVSLYALPIAALNASGRDSITFVSYSAGQPRPGSLPVARKGPNTYWVYVFGSPQVVTTDAAGRVLAVDATRTTLKITAQRQPADVTSLAAVFAQREREGRAAGPMSPRDTVNAAVGPVQIWVDYSRPAARGRRVFGAGGVLGDTLWRTGANAATQFRTSAPLLIGGQTLPAGTYTLWTVAVPGRYQLIFNRQTGQWGTVYDPAQDALRVPLQASRLAQAVERFTISVAPTGDRSAAIRMQWDDTELSVPFTVPE